MAKKIEEEALDEQKESTPEDMTDEDEADGETGYSEEEERILLEKELKKLRKKEIRSVLLGNFAVSEDGRTIAGKNRLITPYGTADGAQAVALFGIKQKRYVYRTTLKNYTQVAYRIYKVMEDIGRVFEMESSPDAVACRVKSYVFRPVVLFFEEVGGSDKKDSCLQLTACCGRSPLAIIPVLRAVSRFEKLLPKEIFRSGKKAGNSSSSSKNKQNTTKKKKRDQR